MVRFGKFEALTSGGRITVARPGSVVLSPVVLALLILAAVAPATMAVAQDDQAVLDRYLQEIEQRISENNLEGARDKLNEALTANLRDESLELIHGQLRLLESLNQSGSPSLAAASDGNNGLTEFDKTAATDLLDSLRVAMENGELDKVRLFVDATPQANSLLNAVFEQYTAMRVEVSAPETDAATQTFTATLEFKELTTKDGDTAFPAQAWKSHRLRVVRSNGIWQKVLW